MATDTNHYEMTKQQSPERVSVGLLNDNFDIIDGVMFANQEKSEQLADDYNASETYNTGDYVRRENYIYKCNSNSVTGNWDSTKWDRVKVMESVDELKEENNDIWDSMNVLGAKNLVPYPTRASEGTYVINSVTFNIGSDGIISTNGTASANTTLTMFARVNDKNNLKAGTYSFSCSPSGSGGSATTFFTFYGLHNGTSWDVTINDYGEGGVFEVTKEMENDGLALNIQIKSGTNVNGLYFKPFVCPASVRDRSYTPYAMTNKNLTDIVKCKQTTAGTYTLQATVDSDKVVTYAWVPTT